MANTIFGFDLSRIAGGRVAELADAQDSKSCGSDTIRVRLPSRPPLVRDSLLRHCKICTSTFLPRKLFYGLVYSFLDFNISSAYISGFFNSGAIDENVKVGYNGLEVGHCGKEWGKVDKIRHK